MGLVLDRVLTSDSYPQPGTGGAQFDPVGGVKQINWSEGGSGDFYAQFAVPMPGRPGKWQWEQFEHYYPLSTAGAFATTVYGVRFRSATAGMPATISADLIYANDPVIVSGAPTKTTALIPAGVATFVSYSTPIGANTDLPWLGGSFSDVLLYVLANAGGSVKSIAAPPAGGGCRLNIRVQGTNPLAFLEFAGSPALFLGQGASVLVPVGGHIELLFDSNNWVYGGVAFGNPKLQSGVLSVPVPSANLVFPFPFQVAPSVVGITESNTVRLGVSAITVSGCTFTHDSGATQTVHWIASGF